MIKTLIFDFGDIFINLDKKAPLRELEKLNFNFGADHLKFNEDYEKGLISTSEFINKYKPKLDEKSFVNSWNSILRDFPEKRLNFIKDLAAKNDFYLILLSNTNDLHISWIKNNIKFFEEFKSCFDAFYLSHEINFRKPDAEIFEFVLSKHHLKAEECLFIDDTSENTIAAANLGIHVWNLNPETQDITQLFSVKKELF